MVKFLKRRWYIIVIIIAVVAIFVYRQSATQAAKQKTSNYTVKRTNVVDTLSLSGKIEASEQASLRFPSSGKLTWVGVKEGDYVKKFQGIAALDQREIQKTLQKYLNSYVQERLTFDQSKDDNREVIIGLLTPDLRQKTLRAFEKAQYDLNNAVLNVELQSIAAESAYLYTPIEGIVTHVDTPQPGVNITPAGAEFTVVNPHSLYFSALADQTEVVTLSEGLAGKVIFDSYPDNELSSTITSIAFTPKEGETGTVYEIKLPLHDSNNTYRLGMTGDVDFILKEHDNVVAIPVKYLRSENGKQYVTKSVQGKPTTVRVTTGITNDTLIEITSGLQEGDIIYDKTP